MSFGVFSKEKLKGFKLVRFGSELFFSSIPYFLNRKFGFPKVLPKFVRFSITMACDSKCQMCSIWNYYNEHPEDREKEVKLEEFKKFVDNNPFLEDILLTGGQTTLRKDIVDMWLYLNKKGYRTGGPTNTANIKRVIQVHEETLEKLSGKTNHFMSISIDGLGEDHNINRGLPNNFEKAMELVDWAKQTEKKYPFFDFTISHNITPQNYTKFPEFVDFFVEKKGLKPTQVSFRPTQSLERFKLIDEKGIIQKDHKQDVLKVINQVMKKYPSMNTYYVKGIKPFFENPQKLVIPCYAGTAIAHVNPFWNVFPCYAMENNLFGNLRDTDFKLKPLWNKPENIKVQKQIFKGQCPNCWSRCLSGHSVLSDPLGICRAAFENINKLF